MTICRIPDDVLAIISATVDGLQIDSAEDAAQTALEWLPIAAPSKQAERLSQMIRDGVVRVAPAWDSHGRVLELSLVKVR